MFATLVQLLQRLDKIRCRLTDTRVASRENISQKKYTTDLIFSTQANFFMVYVLLCRLFLQM